MKNYLVKIPRFVPAIYRNQIWGFLPDKKNIYLTFDDGPTPEITDWVLETLRSYGAKATFFCLGKNIDQHPDIFDRILQNGHTIGNHTYEHLNGWNTPNDPYFTSIDKTQELIESRLHEFKSDKLKAPNNKKPATHTPPLGEPEGAKQPKLFR
ncbi:MAG: polysaccharide deacetylase family protein, partial [Flavobacteriaceae bacterium]|nr:polysaccharide deacetylase family protein [Flavobacteriaceae bacterium]